MSPMFLAFILVGAIGLVHGKEYVMLTAGYTSPYAPMFFSLSPDDHPLPTCLTGTKKMLSIGKKTRAYPALFPGKDKHPILCGGNRDDDSRRCLRYDANSDAWSFNSSAYLLSEKFGGDYGQAWDFHPDVGLIVAAGQVGSAFQTSKIEISTDLGQTKSSLPDIPYPVDHEACIVIVNETTVFLAGGVSENARTYHNYTYTLNLNTEKWTRGPELSLPKGYHSCSLVTHPDGVKDIVVAGGYARGTSCYYQNEVDIINLDTNTRRSGPNLPTYLRGHSQLSYGERLFIFGGFGCTSCQYSSDTCVYMKDIYELDINKNTWTKLPFEIPAESSRGAAMFVDKDICST